MRVQLITTIMASFWSQGPPERADTLWPACSGSSPSAAPSERSSRWRGSTVHTAGPPASSTCYPSTIRPSDTSPGLVYTACWWTPGTVWAGTAVLSFSGGPVSLERPKFKPRPLVLYFFDIDLDVKEPDSDLCSWIRRVTMW